MPLRAVRCGNPLERKVAFSGKWHSVINASLRSFFFIPRFVASQASWLIDSLLRVVSAIVSLVIAPTLDQRPLRARLAVSNKVMPTATAIPP